MSDPVEVAQSVGDNLTASKAGWDVLLIVVSAIVGAIVSAIGTYFITRRQARDEWITWKTTQENEMKHLRIDLDKLEKTKDDLQQLALQVAAFSTVRNEPAGSGTSAPQQRTTSSRGRTS